MKLARFLVSTALFVMPLAGKAQTLSFSGKDIPLKDIFRIIKCQTGVLFFYDVSLLKPANPVTVEWKNLPLEKALNEIFKGQPFTWILEGKTVAVIERRRQMMALAERKRSSLFKRLTF